MVIATTLSEKVMGLNAGITSRLKSTLSQYQLPVSYPIDVKKAMEILKMDKKRNKQHIDYILLEDIGRAIIQPLPFEILETAITICAPE